VNSASGISASPRPFFGYSDNTNLHLNSVELGLVSYPGSSIMVQFGWPVAMHPGVSPVAGARDVHPG
jgi:muramoyltetrapeptide carboxypeptidase LdcA involved in peptidoglycan recycling